MSETHARLTLERAVLDTYRLATEAETMADRRRAAEAVEAVVGELRAHPAWLEDLGLVPPAAMNKPFSGVERE